MTGRDPTAILGAGCVWGFLNFSFEGLGFKLGCDSRYQVSVHWSPSLKKGSGFRMKVGIGAL